MQRLHLDITSDPARLAPVRRAVEAFCTSAGFDAPAVGDVGLCVNEALANVFRHAYGGATDRPVRLEAEFQNDLLEIKIHDWGNGQDPSFVPPKTDPLLPGGLGLVCLRTLMDEMNFQRQPDGMLLTMRRKRKQKAEDDRRIAEDNGSQGKGEIGPEANWPGRPEA